MPVPSGSIVDEDIHDPRNTRTTDTSGPEGILRVARAHRSAGRNQQAIDAYSRLVSDYPFSSRLPEAFLERGLVRLSRGDRTGALIDFDTVAEAFPATPQASEARRQGALLRRR
jgi:tetratricopeptide (TPR) repeat protein